MSGSGSLAPPLRAAAIVVGLVLLVVAGWLGVWTVRTMDGPWGKPGRAGTLTVERCTTSPASGGTGPTMTCTGMFTRDDGGPTVDGVRLSGRAAAWTSGERIRARLSNASQTAYRPGSGDWLVNLAFFLALLAVSAGAIVAGRAPRR